jgi:hypothetical protein
MNSNTRFLQKRSGALIFSFFFIKKKGQRENSGSLNMDDNKLTQFAYVLERQVNRPLS